MNGKSSNSHQAQRRSREKRFSYSNMARSTIDYKHTLRSMNEVYSKQIEKVKLKNETPRRVYLVYVLGIILALVSHFNGGRGSSSSSNRRSVFTFFIAKRARITSLFRTSDTATRTASRITRSSARRMPTASTASSWAARPGTRSSTRTYASTPSKWNRWSSKCTS